MKEYTVVVDAPHAELGKQQHETVTRSPSAVASLVLGLVNDNPGTALTFTITATEVHE